MSDTCETIKIVAKNEQGFIVINLSDYDAKTMKEFKLKAPKPETVEPVETGDSDNGSK